MSSTCFEPEGSNPKVHLQQQVWYGTFYMSQYKQSGMQKSECLDLSVEHTLLATRLLILTHAKHTAYTTVFLNMNPRVRNM